MSTQIVLKVLALRHRLRQGDRRTRQRLEACQARELRLLREYAYARSPFYECFHKGFSKRPFHDLPILTKETVMEHFDELVVAERREKASRTPPWSTRFDGSSTPREHSCRLSRYDGEVPCPRRRPPVLLPTS